MNAATQSIRHASAAAGIAKRQSQRCQWQSFSTQTCLYAKKPLQPIEPPKAFKAPAAPAIPKDVLDPAAAAPAAEIGQEPIEAEAPKKVSPADLPSPFQDAPRAYGKAVEEFTPKPLSRPIGMPNPPQAGDNSGIDARSWKQKRDDFVNYDKHLAKRKMLTKKISAPYFREWSNMRLHKGKTFEAPPRLFKGEHSLWMPNLMGWTLDGREAVDTTDVLKEKVSIVGIFSSAWADGQVGTFVSKEKNPELHKVLEASKGEAQLVQVNIEENALKAGLINLFKGSLKRKIGEENTDKYFVVRKGLTDDQKERIGVLNSKVGYVYLLDGECKIRWAGSGVASDLEREGLVNGVKKLLADSKAKPRPSPNA